MRMKPVRTSILAALLLLAGCGGSDAPGCVQSSRILAVTARGSGSTGIVETSHAIFGKTGNTPISGTVVFGSVNSDNSVAPSNTVAPNASVWLEQQSRLVAIQGSPGAADRIENLITAVTADSNGHFTFCVGPSSGNFEIVADSVNPALGPGLGILSDTSVPTTTAATITTTVPAGRTGLVVPLVSAGAVTISGTVSTQQSSSA